MNFRYIIPAFTIVIKLCMFLLQMVPDGESEAQRNSVTFPKLCRQRNDRHGVWAPSCLVQRFSHCSTLLSHLYLQVLMKRTVISGSKKPEFLPTFWKITRKSLVYSNSKLLSPDHAWSTSHSGSSSRNCMGEWKIGSCALTPHSLPNSIIINKQITSTLSWPPFPHSCQSKRHWLHGAMRITQKVE